MKNIGQLLKQLQKMQGEMKKVQEDLSRKHVSASAGGGAVSAIANGQRRLIEIRIKPEVIDPDEVEFLEDLLLAAVNGALEAAGEMAASEMKKVTGDIKIPGIL